MLGVCVTYLPRTPTDGSTSRKSNFLRSAVRRREPPRTDSLNH